MNHRENWVTDKRDRIIESSKGMEFDEGSVSVGVRSLIGNLRCLFRVLEMQCFLAASESIVRTPQSLFSLSSSSPLS